MLKKDKGQFSLEFMVVLGIILAIFSTTALPLMRSSLNDAQTLTDMSLSRDAANKLSHGVHMVYSSGVGSQHTVEYTLPESVDNIVFDEEVGSEDNRAVIQIHSSTWDENYDVENLADENYVQVETRLPAKNNEDWTDKASFDLSFEKDNLDTSQGDHKVRITYEGPFGPYDTLRITLEEL